MTSSTQSLLDRLNNMVLVRFLLLFASGWAGLQLLHYFEIVVVVFAVAAILAFLLGYPVRWCRRIMPHSLAVTLVFLLGLVGFGGVLMGIAIAVVTQGQGLTASIADFLGSLTPALSQLEDTLQQWNLQVDLQTLGDQLREQAVRLLGAGFGILQTLLENFITGIVIAVVTYFMLLDGARLWNLGLRALPTHRRRQVTVTVQKNLLGFFWGRLLLSIFFGVSTFVVFLLLKVPYALTLAVIAGLFDLIPGIGATIGISLVGLLLLSQSVWLTLQSFIICILLQQVEENVLLPRIMQDSLNINPVVMFFALIVGARIAGVLGVFLAIPIAGIVISLLEIDEMKGHAVVNRNASVDA